MNRLLLQNRIISIDGYSLPEFHYYNSFQRFHNQSIVIKTAQLLDFTCIKTSQKNLQKTFLKALLFQSVPLPLHSKLKNESLKFFKYVTTNQNKITVLRSQPG